MKRAISTIFVLLTLAGTLVAAEPKILFEETFDGKLKDGWTWLREHKQAWRIKDKALEIRAEPGAAHDVKNALLREMPDRGKGTFAMEVTVTSNTVPTEQFEQGGLTLYHDGKPVFKIVKERIDGDLWIIPARVSMRAKSVQLRVIVTSDKFIAQFRPEGKGQFKTAAEGPLPPPGKDQVSIQCYHGPADAEHWIRFDNFRILQLSD